MWDHPLEHGKPTAGHILLKKLISVYYRMEPVDIDSGYAEIGTGLVISGLMQVTTTALSSWV